MNNYKTWSKEEELIIQKNYDYKNIQKCVDILLENGYKRTYNSVKAKAKRLKVIKQANDSGYSVSEFCELTGAKEGTVRKDIRLKKIKTIKKRNGEHVISYSQFEKIFDEYKQKNKNKSKYIDLKTASEKLGFQSQYLRSQFYKRKILSENTVYIRHNRHITIDFYNKIKKYMIEKEKLYIDWKEFECFIQLKMEN